MEHETVDVLIIGAGASGAAIAWSLLETKMRILCLEQGEHLSDADLPSRKERTMNCHVMLSFRVIQMLEASNKIIPLIQKIVVSLQ